MINWIEATHENIEKHFILYMDNNEIESDIYEYEGLFFYDKTLSGGCVKMQFDFNRSSDSPFIKKYVFLSPNAVLTHNEKSAYLKIKGGFNPEKNRLTNLEIVDYYDCDVKIIAFVKREEYEDYLQKLSNNFWGQEIKDIQFVVPKKE